jgi:flavin reductase (DIM6/NTAB) family NADH-FMN oxidoreductase RutF
MFEQVDYTSLELNPFTMMKQETFLITAGDGEKWNTMTAGWGFLGVMWARPAFGIVVRDSRYTYEFLKKSSQFTCSFFPPGYEKALQICGTTSGRSVDKAELTGLHPVVVSHDDQELVTFEEANLVFCCTSASQTDIRPEDFLISDIEKHYPNKDYHTLFIGYIDQVLAQES